MLIVYCYPILAARESIGFLCMLRGASDAANAKLVPPDDFEPEENPDLVQLRARQLAPDQVTQSTTPTPLWFGTKPTRFDIVQSMLPRNPYCETDPS